MISLKRCTSDDKDFKLLVTALDKELAIRDGDEHDFYHQFNKIDALKHVVVAYDGEAAVGCGAIKQQAADTVEVKRMYVPESRRGQGIASIILKELESWAKELNYKRAILETGKKQPEAIALYKKNCYAIITNFGQYAGVENSVCFEKML